MRVKKAKSKFSFDCSDVDGGEDSTTARALLKRGKTLARSKKVKLSAPDATPPETTIDPGPPGTVSNSSAPFSLSSSERRSIFDCSLDGAPFVSCNSPHDLDGLGDGAHNFKVRATDAAANTDPTPAERSFTLDTRLVA